MKQLTLTDDEILYLASYTGADELYGIKDNLSGLSDKQFKLKVMDIEKSLIEKKLLSLGFDDDISVNQDAVNLIKSCAISENIITLECKTKSAGQYVVIYYSAGERSIKIVKSEKENDISEINNKEVKKEIEGKIAQIDSGDVDGNKKSILQVDMDKCSKLARMGRSAKAKEVLIENDFDEEMAETIIDGLTGKANFYSLLLLNKNAMDAKDLGESIIFIDGNQLLQLEYDISEENRTVVVFQSVSAKQLEQQIKVGLEKLSVFMTDGKSDVTFE